MDWLVRGCILLSINAERNIVDRGMYDPLGYLIFQCGGQFSLLSIFFFSFLHLYVQPFLFLSCLMIIFYVPNKLCVLRVKLPMSVL